MQNSYLLRRPYIAIKIDGNRRLLIEQYHSGRMWRGEPRHSCISFLAKLPSTSLTEGRGVNNRRKQCLCFYSQMFVLPMCAPALSCAQRSKEIIRDILIYHLTGKKLSERKLQRNLDNWSKGKLVKEHEMSLSRAVCWKNVECYGLVLVRHHCWSQTQRAHCCSGAVVELHWFGSCN